MYSNNNRSPRLTLAESTNVVTVDFRFVRPSVTKRTEKTMKRTVATTNTIREINGLLHHLLLLQHLLFLVVDFSKGAPDRNPTPFLPTHLNTTKRTLQATKMANRNIPAKMRPQR